MTEVLNMANEPAKKQSLFAKVVDILAIFAMIFIFIIIPPYTPYVHMNNGYMEGAYSLPGYFVVLAVIVVIFGAIMFHSVKSQDY